MIVPWEIKKMEFESWDSGFSGEILLGASGDYLYAVRDHRYPDDDLMERVETGRTKNLEASRKLVEHWITKRLESRP